MDAAQPWLLASGAAVGAGVLGAAIARAWIVRRIQHDARAAAAAIEAGHPTWTKRSRRCAWPSCARSRG